ncbi:MAG: RIP metalloprotease RseP [Pseudomonadales bacterium]|nr:RIP metalloprotease RseP [Pseudomonadales bacterium]
MLEVLQSIVALIVTLSILVTIHEFGHYWVARLCNVHVLRFSIGFGKAIYTRRGKPPAPVPVPEGQSVRTRSNEPLEGTEYAIASIPLGGYVKMLDEREGFVPDDQLHLTFNRKPVWQRIAIVAAGPAANFLLAIAAYWMLFVAGVSGVAPVLGSMDSDSAAVRSGLSQGQEVVAIDGKPVNTWSDLNFILFDRIGDTGNIIFTVKDPARGGFNRDYLVGIEDWLSDAEEPYPAGDLGLTLNLPETPAEIGSVMAGGAAEAAGLQAGDLILAANDVTVNKWADWVDVIRNNPGRAVDLVVDRAGREIRLTVIPGIREADGKSFGYVGAGSPGVAFPEEMRRETSYPFYSAWIPAAKKTWELTAFTFESLGKMITGAISPKNLSGPITIAKVANTSAESGLESFMRFIAILSVSLGVINLLPIPVLDGGHLLYYTFELIARRPVPEKVQLWGLQMGMFIIVSVMLFALINDITRL